MNTVRCERAPPTDRVVESSTDGFGSVSDPKFALNGLRLRLSTAKGKSPMPPVNGDFYIATDKGGSSSNAQEGVHAGLGMPGQGA